MRINTTDKYIPIRRGFPKVYRYQKEGNDYFLVDGRSRTWGLNIRKNFNFKEDALNFAKEIENQIQANGKAVAENRIYQDREIERLDTMLKPFGKTLPQAVTFYVQFMQDEMKKSVIPLIKDLCLKWYESKRDSKNNPLRPKTKSELKIYWRFITQNLGEYKPHEVTHDMAEKLIQDVNSSDTNYTRKTYLKFVRDFFKWCVERGYVSKNPTEKIKVKLNPDVIEFYEPSEIEYLLRLCEDKFPSLVGYYCLTIFGGLRPTEAQRMEWKDVNFETKQIFVNKFGKVGARRVDLKNTDALWVWLEHIKNKHSDQPLNPLKNHAKLQRNSREAFREWTPRKKWIQDGLRHSFGTYYYNLTRNIFETVYVMGNSERIAKKHYLREVSPKWTEKYWAIRPTP